jgi:GT2 family glycosyltransferase
MSQNDLLPEIAFDLFERYSLLEHIAKLFRPMEPGYRVLDVGGHTPSLWPGFSSLAGEVIPDASVTVVDMHATGELRNYVRASGWALPFGDGTFDLVCSMDTLEHIPPENRSGFLAELLRVTRDGLYLAFPFDSASNRWAESLVVEYTRVALKDAVPALLEHKQFGLPDRDSVNSAFARLPHTWVGFVQGNTDVWLLMMLTYHSLRLAGGDFVRELNRRFNQVYAAQDWAEPCYRAGYLLSKAHSVIDLEALQFSLASSERRADLQGVLSLCQLFLGIAQNGRIAVDKDRHIQNIEAALEDARTYKEKWHAAAGVLRHFEDWLAGRPNTSGSPETPAEWPFERISGLLDAAARRRAREQTEMEARLSELGSQLGRIAEQISGLRRQMDLNTRLDGRMRDLEIGLVTNKRAIQAIYDSRIWKALSGAGGWLLRATGRGSRGPSGSFRGSPPQREMPPAWRSPSTEEALELVCDYPGVDGTLPVRDVVEIRGWALAPSGIQRVTVQIGEEPPLSATYGVPRPDVARHYPQMLEAEHSGFRFFWDTSSLPEGACSVRVTAISNGGQSRELTCRVRVDLKTPPDYGLWITRNEPGAAELKQQRLEANRFPLRPRISIAVPVYHTPAELLKRCVDSVLAQTYADWELCLADDGSQDPRLTAVLNEYAHSDPRIKLVTLPENLGISGATNAALKLCAGDYAAFLDHDDELAPFALFEVVRAINDQPDIELFYSDEDKIDEQGRRYDAFFKPDWSPDLFRACNYLCHFIVMKRSLLDRTGGLDASHSGSQDYEFLLRASERTQKIRRIPKLLYHWRAIEGSAAKAPAEKPSASADGQRALTSYLHRNAPGASADEVGPSRYRVRYPIAGSPRVSILIPSGGHKNIFRAVDELLQKTSYRNYEVVLIDNSPSNRIADYAGRLASRQAPVQYLDWRHKPFNFSAMNNAGVRSTDSPYVLFLNDDTAVITNDWLEAMLEHAQRPETGAVGAQLWYPNDTIQHAGVVMGIFGNCSHAFKGLPGDAPFYFDFPNLIRNCSAVTGACLLVARQKFLQAGAFDEVNLAVAFQDVDLCLKLLELGLRNVYTPYAKLYHFESATKTDKDKIPDPGEDAFMKQKWAKYIADDPYYNPNLTRRKEDFSLAID